MPKDIKEDNSDESAGGPPECRTQLTLEGIDFNTLFASDIFTNPSSDGGNNVQLVLEHAPSLSNINSGGSLNLFSFVEPIETESQSNNVSLPEEIKLLVSQEETNLDEGKVFFKAVYHTESNKAKSGTYAMNPFIEGATVRTTAVHRTPGGVLEPILRCEEHSSQEHSTNEGFPYPLHFIRCTTTGSWYEVDERGGFLSVCTPVPDNSSGDIPVIYRLMCRTSCVDRRSITIQFELLLNNEVLATDNLDVRVCACPTRDKGNEEKTSISGTAVQALETKNHSKKRKCVDVFKVKSPAAAAAGRLFASYLSSVKKPR